MAQSEIQSGQQAYNASALFMERLDFAADVPREISHLVDRYSWGSLNTIFQTEKDIRSENTWKQWRVSLDAYARFILSLSEASRSGDIIPAHETDIKLWIDRLVSSHVSMNTIQNRISSLTALHDELGFTGKENPCRSMRVNRGMARARRILSVSQSQALPIRITGSDEEENCAKFGKLIDAAGDSVMGQRNKLLLSAAMFTGVRRSELVNIKPGHIRSVKDGKGVLSVCFSKTDQEGRGSERHLPRTFMRAYTPWMEFISRELGKPIYNCPVFPALKASNSNTGYAVLDRGIDQSQVPRIFKKLAMLAGYSESICSGISGHSTRVGLSQELCLKRRTTLEIMHALDWKSEATVLRYVSSILTEQNAAADVLAEIMD